MRTLDFDAAIYLFMLKFEWALLVVFTDASRLF